MPGVSWHMYSGWNSHPKNDALASAPVSHPPCCELAVSRKKKGGVEEVMVGHVPQASLVWPVPPPLECQHWCSHTCSPPTFVTLYLARWLQKTFKWTHGVSYSPIIEESYLSDAGLAMDNLHFVVLPQSHSLPEFVPLGWWCTWPA